MAGDELPLDAVRDAFRQPFDGVLRIEIVDTDANIWVDGRGDKVLVGETAPAGVENRYCLWRLALGELSQVLDPSPKRFEASMIAGRVSVSGDMAVMARLEFGHG